MSFYQKDSQQHTRLTDPIKKYETHITSNPQEEELVDDFPPTPTTYKRRFYFTEEKLSENIHNTSPSYSQVTSSTSLSATQISSIPDTVASKNTQEIKAATTYQQDGHINLDKELQTNVDDTFRIIAGNIHGFCLDKASNSKLHEIFLNLHSLTTSAFLFQEINPDFKQRQVQQTYKKIRYLLSK